MGRLRLLDLFCGEGGAGMGYARAGFDVVGVDVAPQKRYPFTFVCGDAFDYLDGHWREFDVVHASPPCQAYSVTRRMTGRTDHPDLVGRIRQALVGTGLPYVVENVPGAPLVDPLLLCGSMFGLGVLRHRLFECAPSVFWPPASCDHAGGVLSMWWSSRCKALARGERFRYLTVAGKSFLVGEASAAMGIDWMSRRGLAQAIPPVFTEYVGRQLMGMV